MQEFLAAIDKLHNSLELYARHRSTGCLNHKAKPRGLNTLLECTIELTIIRLYTVEPEMFTRRNFHHSLSSVKLFIREFFSPVLMNT